MLQNLLIYVQRWTHEDEGNALPQLSSQLEFHVKV